CCIYYFHHEILKARVAFSSIVGGELAEEAKSINAGFLLLRNSRNPKNKNGISKGISKYCFDHAHEGCTVVSVGKFAKAEQGSSSNSKHTQGSLVLLNEKMKIETE
ncbi:hypothetical protein HN51_061911, partial [Arachis hypogaea]